MELYNVEVETWAMTAIVETLSRLAAPCRRQEAYLREFGTWPSLDELALEFDDAYRPLVTPTPDPGLPSLAVARLGMLDRKLAEMGKGGPALWSDSALASDPAWAEVRAFAAAALEALTPVPA